MSIVQFRKSDFIPSEAQAAPGKKIVIAVDGPAASGKGTLSRKMAERLGYAFLDTGALYRAVAYATLELGGDPSRYEDVEPALAIVKRNLTPELLSNPALRSAPVSEAASQVAALAEVRIDLLDYQREFAKNPPGDVGGVVVDGRDIGTVVCPDADIKFFVTASVDERARRRFEEQRAAGVEVSYPEVLSALKIRDERDSTRAVAPTRAADDAYVLDTTTLNPAETLDEAISVIRARFLAETNDNGAISAKTPEKKAF